METFKSLPLAEVRLIVLFISPGAFTFGCVLLTNGLINWMVAAAAAVVVVVVVVGLVVVVIRTAAVTGFNFLDLTCID